MRQRLALTLGACIWLLQGCEVLSPDGYFSSQTQVKRPTLVGSWEYAEDGEVTSTLDIRPQGETYVAVLTEIQNGKRGDRFEAVFTMHEIRGRLIAEYHLRPPKGVADITARDLMSRLAMLELRNDGPLIHLPDADRFEEHWKVFSMSKSGSCDGILRRQGSSWNRPVFVVAPPPCLEEFVGKAGDAIWDINQERSSRTVIRKRK